MQTSDIFSALLHSGAFWAALMALAQGLLYYFAPQFPRSLFMLITGFIVTCLAILGIRDVTAKARLSRDLRLTGGKD